MKQYAVEHAVFQRFPVCSRVLEYCVLEKSLTIGIMVTCVAHCYSVTCPVQAT